MTGTKDEASAKVWLNEFSECECKPNSLRRSVILAAIAAAIFVFDVYLCTPGSAMTYRHMSQNIVQASSGFQNLISTICWLVGMGFIVNSGIKIFRACRRPPDDPLHKSLWRRGILYLFLGIGCMSFPFVQAAAVSPPAYIFNNGYISPRIVEEHGASLKLLSILCWYFCLAFFLNADINFREAQRLKDDPAAAASLKTKTALYALIGFVLLAAPAVYALLSAAP